MSIKLTYRGDCRAEIWIQIERPIAVANWERPASGTMATLHSLAKTIRFHLARAQDEVEKVQDVLYSITH